MRKQPTQLPNRWNLIPDVPQNKCSSFADPYVEHDALTLWIDLVLLKRDVFRHLLYNRGTGARRLSDDSKRTTDGSVPEGAARDREKVGIIASPEGPH